MIKKLFLSDFDGTLVSRDILDLICGIAGKEEESRAINEEFINGRIDGLSALRQRVDFLTGISLEQINTLLDKEQYLITGAQNLFNYLKTNNYVTVLHSGNLLPVLEYYKNILSIDHIIGTKPRIDGGKLAGIEPGDIKNRNFKVDGCKEIISKLNIPKKDIIAIGDSPADLGVFNLAGKKIAINPKGGIEKEADFIADNNLVEVIDFLERVNSNAE